MAFMPSMRDSRREKWLRWLEDEIQPEVMTMNLHRHVFTEVGDIIEAHGSLPPSYWFEFSSDTYATTQAIAIRRHIADAAFTKQFAPGGGDHLDPTVPNDDLMQLAWVAAEVKIYVDEHVAHNDARPSAGLPTFGDLNASIDLIGELFAKYANLLTAAMWPILVPAIQHNWKAIFAEPWIEQSQWVTQSLPET